MLKRFIAYYIKPLYLTNRLYTLLMLCVLLFLLRFFFSWPGALPYIALMALGVAIVYDYALLFSRRAGVFATRTLADRLSNGDDNTITIHLENRYPVYMHLDVIDEIPHQFNKRDIAFQAALKPGETKLILYQLRPVKRGAYSFGVINVFVQSRIALVKRRYTLGGEVEVKVYPSYLQLRKYQLMAISNRLSEAGVKKMRRIGHSMEFEQIKAYVTGDDYRTVNWKATARRGELMVNNYTDEKSQQLVCVIDKSRLMKMPFDGLSLLDYAINTTLVLSNVALMKQDRAGLISFADKISTYLPPEKKAAQMQYILEALYNQKTRYPESDFEQLYIFLRRKITQRSMVMLFTNFESLTGMRRQLPYLKKIAEHHMLITVFFENTELQQFIEKPSARLQDVYTKTIAEQFAFEKRQIVKELNQAGILAILTPPKQLTVSALNKYLEIKARQQL